MWLDEWFRNYIQPSSKIKTCERYSEIIEKHLKVKLGEYELDELTPLVYFMSYWNNRRICTANGGLPPMEKRRRYELSAKRVA